MADLVDLEKLSKELRESYTQNFKEGDCTLPIEFKQKVTKIKTFSLKYDKYTTVFIGNGENSFNSYIPNQLFYVAAFFSDLVKELFKYKQQVIKILEKANIPRVDYQDFFTKEKDAGKAMVANGNDPFEKLLEQQGVVGDQKDFLLKFVTDYKWWAGGKTIDRQDFFNSSLLSTIGVTAASNSTLANICEFVSENSEYLDLLNKHRDIEFNDKPNKKEYNKDTFIKETFLTEEDADEITGILTQNKNIILQGAPGVGKTWTAKRIAYLMQRHICDETIECVQFHQSYSYDSFIEGYRPTEASFSLEEGIFQRFCRKAMADGERDYFFIIDEINRGNISKILGELLSLIEVNYRGEKHSMPLSYSQKMFYVPDNLYIIGMMNTSDRSLSIIDYALRRRFAFISMAPKFDSVHFKEFNASVQNPHYSTVIDAIKELNKAIVEDPSLGVGFEIGHSYFCFGKDVTDQDLTTIIKYQIIPIIKEYWFDNTTKAEEEINKLLESVK